TVRLWDAATGQALGEPLEGHTDEVLSVAFSPDGTRIASGSWDKTVRLWDAATGQALGEPLEGHTAFVSSVSPEHALTNPIDLVAPTSHYNSISTPFLLQADGWMMGPNQHLLFWVPPAPRHAIYTPWTLLVIPEDIPSLI
ncbi:hypothetical protein P692DRAFT_201700359, partial [Suillus brevipes Sb2]